MRTDENSEFTLHKTATQDWYAAGEVDQRISQLKQDRDVPTDLLERLIDYVSDENGVLKGKSADTYMQTSEIIERRKT